jgi:hypothetical protein
MKIETKNGIELTRYGPEFADQVATAERVMRITDPPRQCNSKYSIRVASMPERNDCHGSGMDLEGMAQMFR